MWVGRGGRDRVRGRVRVRVRVRGRVRDRVRERVRDRVRAVEGVTAEATPYSRNARGCR